MPTADQELDTRNLTCPLPLLKVKKAINSMATGQILKIIATDPSTVRDFDVFAMQTGHQLLESTESARTAGPEYHFLLRKV